MWELFSSEVLDAIKYAQKLAMENSRESVLSQDLLLGSIVSARGELYHVLRDFGITIEEARKLYSPDSRSENISCEIGFSVMVKHIFALACCLADNELLKQVKLNHILLAIIFVENNKAYLMLVRMLTEKKERFRLYLRGMI